MDDVAHRPDADAERLGERVVCLARLGARPYLQHLGLVEACSAVLLSLVPAAVDGSAGVGMNSPRTMRLVEETEASKRSVRPRCGVRPLRRVARRTALTSDRPLTPAEIVSVLRPHDFYLQGSPEARDAFFLARIRTDPRPLADPTSGRLPPPPPPL